MATRTTSRSGTRAGTFRELVHTPAELALEHVQWAERMQDCPGVPFGIPAVDEKVVPFHPGDMIVFCARPGHYKTSMLAYFARAEAKRIVKRGTQDKECVLYVTWEQVTEEINSVLETNEKYTVSDIVWGRVNMSAVRLQSLQRASMPIWILGDSLARTNSRSPRMYPDVVFSAIESIEDDFGIKPSLMLFDYIQLIPTRGQIDRHKQVIEGTHRCKELAKRVGCPAVVAVQAKREVDDRKNKTPLLSDGLWASDIEHTADKYFGQWRPWLTEPHFILGEDGRPILDGSGQASPNVILVDGREYPITPELVIVAMRKQRFEEGRHTWALRFQPQYLRLCELEVDVEEVPL